MCYAQSVPDPDLDMVGGGGGGIGHPDLKIRGGASLLRASVSSKNKGGAVPLDSSPGLE